MREKTQVSALINAAGLDKRGNFHAVCRNNYLCYHLIVVIVGTFELIGEIMIRLTSLIEKVRAEGRAEGKAEGKAEIITQLRQYFAWERRREKATANNQPFDEPPPPKPEGYPEE